MENFKEVSSETINEIAFELDIEPALIYAIVTVESDGKFEIGDGKITVLFERHWFYKLLKKKYGYWFARETFDGNPDICNPKSGGYGLYRDQYKRLAKAINIDMEVAHQSASFGAFQIMGFNYKLCGYDSAKEMSDAYHFNPENEQIRGFIEFVKNSSKGRLWEALEKRNFKEVARLYNGSAYKKNNYDAKLQVAYLSYLS